MPCRKSRRRATTRLRSTGLLRDGSSYDEDRELGERRARAALLLELALPGSAYVYQGEELGLFEVADVFVRFARASQNFSKKVLA